MINANAPVLTFWHRYAFEPGADSGNVWITTDNGNTFTQLSSFTGSQNSWTRAQIDLRAFAGESSIQIYFQVVSNATVTADGWYIDDVQIANEASPGVPSNNPPQPTAPPITTTEGEPGTTQISVNDPDAGQVHLFELTTPPLNGIVTNISINGIVTYLPNSGFVGTDSLIITVFDSGTPTLSGSVEIDVIVSERVSPSSGFLGTWSGTWESSIPPELGGGDGDVTIVFTSEEETFPGSNSFDLTGTLTMTGPGKEAITNIPVQTLFGASLESGFIIDGVPRGELSSCNVNLGVTDVFSPTHMAGVYLIQGVCQNVPIDAGIFEVRKE
ncbi:Ig-like domain-containing protein [Candidatus Entotheonella palauensis]|uniref:Ig-like domain-containing protein n=1 Tax=Candidatus Entotheonella palauensis TaxID=93172 RepID=UPI0015C43742|nr:Ig-like domain-containing protein [Candidatus Entotheonella palauensis]